MQKTICDRFADEVIEEKPELDPVKRSWVLKRKVVKPRGNWRWMGDIILNGVSRVARRIGFVPNSNRRQGGNPILGPIATFAYNNWLPFLQVDNDNNVDKQTLEGKKPII